MLDFRAQVLEFQFRNGVQCGHADAPARIEQAGGKLFGNGGVFELGQAFQRDDHQIFVLAFQEGEQGDDGTGIAGVAEGAEGAEHHVGVWFGLEKGREQRGAGASGNGENGFAGGFAQQGVFIRKEILKDGNGAQAGARLGKGCDGAQPGVEVAEYDLMSRGGGLVAGGAVQQDGILDFAEPPAQAGGQAGMVPDELGQLERGMMAAPFQHLHGADGPFAILPEDVLDVGSDAFIGQRGIPGVRCGGPGIFVVRPVLPALQERRRSGVAGGEPWVVALIVSGALFEQFDGAHADGEFVRGQVGDEDVGGKGIQGEQGLAEIIPPGGIAQHAKKSGPVVVLKGSGGQAGKAFLGFKVGPAGRGIELNERSESGFQIGRGKVALEPAPDAAVARKDQDGGDAADAVALGDRR